MTGVKERGQKSGFRHRNKAIKTGDAEKNLSLEIHRGWVFDSSASTVESKRDTTCQGKKESQTDEGGKEMKGGEKEQL